MYWLFLKESGARVIKDKSASTVANFLYEIISRHGYIKIPINDQGKELVNQVAESKSVIKSSLLKMTGTEQKITSVYHPQSNVLCERQNRTIKDSLMKVLEEFSLIQKNIRRWNFQYHNTTLSYRNPVLIYEVWIANKVSRLNALT